MDMAGIFIGILVIFGIATFFSGLYTVDTAESAVVQRFGKFVRIAGAGRVGCSRCPLPGCPSLSCPSRRPATGAR